MSDFRLRPHASQARQHKKRHGPNTPKMALDCRVNRVFSLVQQQVGENMFYLRICCSSAVFVYLVKGKQECATFEEVHLGSASITLTQMEWGLFRYPYIYIYTHTDAVANEAQLLSLRSCFCCFILSFRLPYILPALPSFEKEVCCRPTARTLFWLKVRSKPGQKDLKRFLSQRHFSHSGLTHAQIEAHSFSVHYFFYILFYSWFTLAKVSVVCLWSFFRSICSMWL